MAHTIQLQFGNVTVEDVPDFSEKCWFPRTRFAIEYDPLVLAAFIRLLNGKNIVYSLTTDQFEQLCDMVHSVSPKENYAYGILIQESLGKNLSDATSELLSHY